MAIGTGVAAPDAAAPAVPEAPVRSRSIRLPKSPKIIIGLALFGVFVFLAIFGPMLAPHDPGFQLSTTTSFPQPPSAKAWLGTNHLQNDVLSQLLVGGRPVMIVAFLAGVTATVLSVVIGVSAGYFGGLVDDLLTVLINVSLVLPALPLLIVLTGFLSSSSSANDILIGLIISITGWAFGARVLRIQTLTLRQQDFVESARLIGERSWRIIAFEILPGLLPIVASSFLFTVIYGVGVYASLAFLGLIAPTHYSWGTMLFDAESHSAVASHEWWWFLPPGLAVALLGTSLALLNFGIDEFINPRLRVAGLSRKVARQAGLPRRFQLGLTPVAGARRAHGGTLADSTASSTPGTDSVETGR